jgi:glucokinase
MHIAREKLYHSLSGVTQGILGADIGGTNSNFGFFSYDKQTVQLIFSLHLLSKEIISFSQTIHDILDYAKTKYHFSVTHAVFAAAGIVSEKKDFCKPTNLSFVLDASDIFHATQISYIRIINDFAAIGYGLPFLIKDDIVCIHPGVEIDKGNKAILGAGTGLGTSFLVWHEHANRYLPVASEGGHADFVIHTEQEYHLMHFFRTCLNKSYPISWENILSGDGIACIFHFFSLHDTTHTTATTAPHPDEIFMHRHDNDACWKTYRTYAALYGRCAKNITLTALARGGIYIAGGIAAKNSALFTEDVFLSEFFMNEKQQEMLMNVPIHVIINYNVSLYGAAAYLLEENSVH